MAHHPSRDHIFIGGTKYVEYHMFVHTKMSTRWKVLHIFFFLRRGNGLETTLLYIDVSTQCSCHWSMMVYV